MIQCRGFLADLGPIPDTPYSQSPEFRRSDFYVQKITRCGPKGKQTKNKEFKLDGQSLDHGDGPGLQACFDYRAESKLGNG